MLRVRVRYERAADFQQDAQSQLSQRGLFVRIPPPTDLAPFSPVQLIVAAGIREVVLDGQVVQIAPGVGIAVSFAEATATAISALPSLGADLGESGAPPTYEIVPDAPSEARAPAASTGGRASESPTKADKIQMALRGTKEQRHKILRDHDRTLHLYLLKNPRLGLDEVTTLAKTPTTSVEVIKAISEKREWFQRPEVAIGLVRNPKTPVPIAIRMLDHISKQELRRLAKSDSARMPILQAARKKVIGPL